jgi:hypothetical protein
MGEADAERRQPVEQAAEDHAGDGERGLGRHAHEPAQVVALQPLAADHLPGNRESEAGHRSLPRKNSGSYWTP